MFISTLKFKPDFVIVQNGTTHWFMLALPSFFGIRVVPMLVNALWYIRKKNSIFKKFILLMDGWFFKNRCFAVLTVPKRIADQALELCAGCRGQVITFLSTYKRSVFKDITEPVVGRLPFRVLFIGRVELNKGIFTLQT